MKDETIKLGESRIYALPTGGYLRVCSMLDDEMPYGYDLFGPDRKLVDGGVFGDPEAEPLRWGEALREAADICGLPPDAALRAVQMAWDAEYGDLEELGFSGF